MRDDGELLAQCVVETLTLITVINSACRQFAPALILLGNGTGSKPIHEALVSANLPLAIELVEESHTSEEARKRFVAENPAQGWQRFLPYSLRTPDKPYDDYVAIILAERYFAQQKNLESEK